MRKSIGVVINPPTYVHLDELVAHRSTHTIPYGGKFRIIDFPLSSLVNSDLRKVGIIGTDKYRSLIDHIGTGQEWSLSKKSNDLAILHGGKHAKIGSHTRINLQDFYDNIVFFTKGNVEVEDVIIMGCHVVCNIDFGDTLKQHRENQNDVTMIYQNNYQGKLTGHEAQLEIEGARVSRIHDVRHHEEVPLFLDMLIIKKKLLLETIEIAYNTRDLDLIDIIASNLKGLNVGAHEYEGYVRLINNIQSFFQGNLDLKQPEIVSELFLGKKKIHTKIRDHHPAKYAPNSITKNSIIGSGSKIYGLVDNSIVARESYIGVNAKIKNCILMDDCMIGDGVVLENAILDKDVTISNGKVLVGTEDSPLVIPKGSRL